MQETSSENREKRDNCRAKPACCDTLLGKTWFETTTNVGPSFQLSNSTDL